MTHATHLAPRILVVDDETTNLKILRQILQNDYRLSFAKNGKDALTLAQREAPVGAEGPMLGVKVRTGQEIGHGVYP